MSIPADPWECLPAENILADEAVHPVRRLLGKLTVMVLSDIMKFDALAAAENRCLHSAERSLLPVEVLPTLFDCSKIAGIVPTVPEMLCQPIIDA